MTLWCCIMQIEIGFSMTLFSKVLAAFLGCACSKFHRKVKNTADYESVIKN